MGQMKLKVELVVDSPITTSVTIFDFLGIKSSVIMIAKKRLIIRLGVNSIRLLFSEYRKPLKFMEHD
jgi:hypothetical protein